MEKLELTKCEECSLMLGVAPEKTILKQGRILWDDLESCLDELFGSNTVVPERLQLFTKMVRLQKKHKQHSLKKWLKAQLESIDEHSDFLGRNTKWHLSIRALYQKHLDAIS